ncbi:MAG TPA: cytochrome b/b6 domain-containing protein [Tangfeifania sp.]|nr:cytochrome b/b6 domain-containing protein [Tangfeifania sp.]
MESGNKIYFYPTWLRIWHGINAIGIILLIISGYLMQSGSAGGTFQFMVNMHNIAGIIVSVNYLVFVVANVVTGNGRYYIIKPKNFLKRPMKQAYYYAWGMFHGMKKPYPLSENRKFNPLQKYTYLATMYLLVPLVIVSGIALLFPEIIIEDIYNVSGIMVTAVFHSAIGFFLSIFLIVHIYIASIGESPKENFKSIIDGWHHV